MKKILDTSILIYHWNQSIHAKKHALTTTPASRQLVRIWARDLIKLRQSQLILTPIYIEFIAGATSARDLLLFRTFLGEFKILDDGSLSKADLVAAQSIAERVPPDGRPRQLGDCLIRALARRLNYDVVSKDLAFPK